MKFSAKHYEELKAAIASSDIDLKESKQAYSEKGLSDKRFYWDIFWACGYNKNDEFRQANYFDTHIETAVKTAIKELLNN